MNDLAKEAMETLRELGETDICTIAGTEYEGIFSEEGSTEELVAGGWTQDISLIVSLRREQFPANFDPANKILARWGRAYRVREVRRDSTWFDLGLAPADR